MNNFFETYNSDQIVYNGDPVESFGISTGETLTSVVSKVLTKLEEAVSTMESVKSAEGITSKDIKTGSSAYSIKNFAGATAAIENRVMKYSITKTDSAIKFTYSLSTFASLLPTNYTIQEIKAEAFDSTGAKFTTLTDKNAGLNFDKSGGTFKISVIISTVLGTIEGEASLAVTSVHNDGVFTTELSLIDSTYIEPVDANQEEFNKIVSDKISALEMTINSLRLVTENGSSVELHTKVNQMSLDVQTLKDSVNQPVKVTVNSAEKDLQSAISTIESSINSLKNTVNNTNNTIDSVKQKLTNAGI